MAKRKSLDDIDELPEVLEFLKQSRIIIRQLKLFSCIEISDENKEIIKNATIKLSEEAEKYIANTTKEDQPA